ncbi:DoxX family protein [Streptomyces sp. NPDC059853]|uniref:DoxX family protein n=1 Tax=Streptomyces sp. NPDC059853 TaxID=3346973 RepID=UPI00364B2F36
MRTHPGAVMFIGYGVVSVLLSAILIGTAAVSLSGNAQYRANLRELRVPDSWQPRLAFTKLAGGVGLLAGLVLVPLGVAAAAGVICYFIGAVLIHLRAGDRGLVPPIVSGLLAVAALILRLASA